MLSIFPYSTLYRALYSFDICVILTSSFLLVWPCRKIKTRRNTGRRVGEAAARGNQDPPHAPVVGVQVPVNPAALMDGKVRETLVQMAQAITA